jgi:pyridoxine/pyridoxamine 5'-phosphate oxidase
VTRAELLAFLRRRRLAVVATVAPGGAPEAALVGFAVTDELEIVFDTALATRKVANLRASSNIALVVGWDGEATVQLEGMADFPASAELGPLQSAYFAAYPEGVARAADHSIGFVRVRLTWARLSDFAARPPRIEELVLT